MKSQKVYFSTFRLVFFPLTFRLFPLFDCSKFKTKPFHSSTFRNWFSIYFPPGALQHIFPTQPRSPHSSCRASPQVPNLHEVLIRCCLASWPVTRTPYFRSSVMVWLHGCSTHTLSPSSPTQNVLQIFKHFKLRSCITSGLDPGSYSKLSWRYLSRSLPISLLCIPSKTPSQSNITTLCDSWLEKLTSSWNRVKHCTSQHQNLELCKQTGNLLSIAPENSWDEYPRPIPWDFSLDWFWFSRSSGTHHPLKSIWRCWWAGQLVQ